MRICKSINEAVQFYSFNYPLIIIRKMISYYIISNEISDHDVFIIAGKKKMSEEIHGINEYE